MWVIMRSKMSMGFRVVVPREVRDVLGLAPGDFIVWELHGDCAVGRPEKREKKLIKGINGIISVGGDALVSKKKIQRGGS
jgi:bifunctional DNA-binding transcriptional regulator/antitoxin component of YhaV-PrlF toxin-antitoxin module